ncbi:helix-turn-helix transcriptional regulator [Lysinibacillus louembei]|uniref:Helix-turn-helix transcriptional regulator n=1 Tax=Lysinibacillus louembei TaxID=1470088 RepID=A0ABZ0RYC5_9BACI|nr:helix-turn-helix transcriptional regulator [Lysinibacillus louembei]WPK12277.1 helix-turn-helix transcriptional regulator [Lysinibacillus louembei]
MHENRLRILMAERRISITKLASEADISRTTLTNIYYERAKGITFETLDKLCIHLECTPNDLLIIKT